MKSDSKLSPAALLLFLLEYSCYKKYRKKSLLLRNVDLGARRRDDWMRTKRRGFLGSFVLFVCTHLQDFNVQDRLFSLLCRPLHVSISRYLLSDDSERVIYAKIGTIITWTLLNMDKVKLILSYTLLRSSAFRTLN